MKRPITARQAAEMLGVHVHTVIRMSDRGELPFFRVTTRGDRRYRPEDIEWYIRQREERGRGSSPE